MKSRRSISRKLFRPAGWLLGIAILALPILCPQGPVGSVTHAKTGGNITEGTLIAGGSDGKSLGPCPLAHTSVKAQVSGFMSRVTVTQEFQSPFDDKIEAVYMFPLPQNSAVDDMRIQVGDHSVVGKIMRRADAKATYDNAKANGQVAALLDQERPNIFTQSVANIMPGNKITVQISYVETLKYEDGAYEFMFPMVVGERYNPASTGSTTEPAAETSSDTDKTESDSPRQPSSSNSAPAAIDMPVAPKGMRVGHDISLEVDIDAGVPINDVSAKSHEVNIARQDAGRAIVTLKDEAAIPNKDFVLRYDVAGQTVSDAVLAHRDDRGGYFTLILQPPDRVTVADVTPKELVFVVDTSGSMEGFPLDNARRTILFALGNLNPGDTFNLITFSGDDHVLFKEPVAATPENITKAKKFMENSNSGGGTEMMKAIHTSLDPSDAQGHMRIVCFATDGQVGNDQEIIAEVQKHPNARVFALGFGDAPNRFLLDKMAEYGRGEVEYITEDDAGKIAAAKFYDRVRDPLLTDITVDWNGLPITDVYPQRISDLFSAKPVVLSGRFTGEAKGVIRLKGKMSGREVVREIPVDLSAADADHDVLATLWARRKIDDLMGHDYAGAAQGQMKDELDQQVTNLSLEYRLMTQFTSFVAVDEATVTPPGDPRKVKVPVESTSGAPDTPDVDANDVIKTEANNSGTNVSTEQSSNFPTSRTVQGLYAIAPTSASNPSVGGSTGPSATVNVSSSASALNSSDSELSTIVDNRKILDLPLNGRSPQNLVLLAPGTVAPGARAIDQGATNGPVSSGQRSAQSNFVLDGAAAPLTSSNPPPAAITAPGLNISGLTAAGGSNAAVPMGSLQEVTITTFNGPAEFGRTTGARINYVSKSGTNEFHGLLFTEFGNDVTDANDWFANARQLNRPARRLNNFGGSFGGPFKRDRSFFYGTYEGLRLREPFFGLTDVPTIGSRLAAPVAIRPFLNAYPLPNGTARIDGFAEFAASFSNPASHEVGSFRIDQVVNDKVQFSGHYNFGSSSASERGGNGNSLNTVSRNETGLQSATGSTSVVVSPSVVFDALGNYSRVSVRNSAWLDNFGGALLPIGGVFPASLFAGSNGANAFDLNGRDAKLWSGGAVENVRQQLNFAGSVTAVSGNHSFKLGADYRRAFFRLGSRPVTQTLLFNGIADALSGNVSRFNQYERTGTTGPTFSSVALYAQDTWRTTSRFTLNYGLRWELSPPPSAADRNSVAAVTSAGDPAQIHLAPPGTSLWQTTYTNFAPRVGGAYELPTWHGRSLVLRGGFGLFYDADNEGSIAAFGDSYPFLNAGVAYNTPFPGGPVNPAAVAVEAPLVAFAPNLKQPYLLQWNVSAQQELGSNQSIGVAYLGTHGQRLWSTQTIIDPNPSVNFLRLTDNEGESDYRSLQVQYLRNVTNGLRVIAAYTLESSHDNITGDSLTRAILRSPDLSKYRAPSDLDTRHTLTAWISYEMPYKHGTGFRHALLTGWGADSVIDVRSAQPVNVIYGTQTDFGFAYLRPDLVTGVPLYLIDNTAPGGRRINPAAFAIPASQRQGNLARNSLRGFSFAQFDLAVRRKFYFTESVSLQFKVEAFNVLNHPNFADPAGTENSLGNFFNGMASFSPNATFGQTSAMSGRSSWGGAGRSFNSYYLTGGPRTLQFSLRFEF